ncbi:MULTISPECIES: MATE family efflux transporter [Oscillospiraceae]|uniref:MATE family efflux protein n=1 Tax=Harryflintia acetispora TaxID=1849041 RepID=A0A9X8Y742_9FIRM|nr:MULTISPECIES: MATE family efflux transporter [Oscillospiraceae]RGB64770.1 MATE family efflux transporter [Harryflintia acetispora]TCL41006.1 putative MATE family efflux protein [Harryflintia acetispora]
MQREITLDSNTSLFHLTWPIFIEILLQILVGNIDQIMLSHYSDTAVAAVGNANQIINMLILVFSVISTATTILVSQYLGAGNREKVAQLYTLAFLVNLALSLAVAGGILLFNRPIFRLMSTPQELMGDAVTYLGINGGLISLQAVFLTFTAIFRSNELMKESMAVSVVINLCNILGNLLLIHGAGPFPALGVAGAAIASCLSRLIGIGIMAVLFSREIGVRLSLRLLRPFPGDLLRKLLMIGLPSGGEHLSYNLAQTCCLTFLNIMGTAVVTTKVYAMMFTRVAAMFTSSLAQASQIVVGHMAGAGKMEECDRRTMRTLRVAVPITLPIVILMFLCSDFLFGLFTDNPEILRMGRIVLGFQIVNEMGHTINSIFVKALQAAGDVQFPVAAGVVSQWVISVGGGWLFGLCLGMGIAGIWLAMTIDECLRALVMFLRWRSGIWRTKVQVSEEERL